MWASGETHAMDTDRIAELIAEALPEAEVEVRTRSDHPEDDHYEATVVSPAFVGKTLVEQHELVYDALEGYMTTDIHAIELSTYAPDEAPESP